LQKGLQCLEDGITSIANDNLCLIRQVLKGYVIRRLQFDVSDKIFSAVLGRCLRTGKIECFPCLTINGKVRRIYVGHENFAQFSEKVERVRKLLQSQTAVSTNSIQEACFPGRGSGTWFMSQQLAEYLAYAGWAVYADKDLFVLPEVLGNAKRKTL